MPSATPEVILIFILLKINEVIYINISFWEWDYPNKDFKQIKHFSVKKKKLISIHTHIYMPRS